jgi:hypothetical protein
MPPCSGLKVWWMTWLFRNIGTLLPQLTEPNSGRKYFSTVAAARTLELNIYSNCLSLQLQEYNTDNYHGYRGTVEITAMDISECPYLLFMSSSLIYVFWWAIHAFHLVRAISSCLSICGRGFNIFCVEFFVRNATLICISLISSWFSLFPYRYM